MLPTVFTGEIFYIKITTIYFTEYQPKRKTSVKKTHIH